MKKLNIALVVALCVSVHTFGMIQKENPNLTFTQKTQLRAYILAAEEGRSMNTVSDKQYQGNLNSVLKQRIKNGNKILYGTKKYTDKEIADAMMTDVSGMFKK